MAIPSTHFMSWKSSVIEGARRVGALRVVGASWGLRRLTVLCYHRIGDADAPGFDVYSGTMSATPDAFPAQLDLVADRFNVVAMDRLVAWLKGTTDLPKRPAVITFDDGYADNSTFALPALRERGLPATIFLTTSLIGSGDASWWDRLAYGFHHTAVTDVEIPTLGSVQWSSDDERDRLVEQMIQAIKTLPESDKLAAIDETLEALGVDPAPGTFDGLFLTWDQVREMEAAGFTAAAHTMTHPVLTRLDQDDATAEIVGSVDRVAEEVGRPVDAFAYPNGMPGDYDEVAFRALAGAGIGAAFTLSPGPTRATEAAADPLRIRRIYVAGLHSLTDFETRLEGIPRVADAVRRGRVRLGVPGRA